MEESYEVLELTPAEGEPYSEVIKRYILKVDLSHQSTAVQLGIGGATGWITGALVGKVGKVLAGAVGGSLLLINMGTRAGYITVDWEKVEDDMQEAGQNIAQKLNEERNSDRTRKVIDQVTVFVKRNVVCAGGFAAGFFLGMAT